MSKRTDREFLSDIREALERITTYVAGMNYESFVDDVKTQDAVIRNLEILGEATKNLSPGTARQESNDSLAEYGGGS